MEPAGLYRSFEVGHPVPKRIHARHSGNAVNAKGNSDIGRQDTVARNIIEL